MAAMRAWSADELRSVNGQIEFLLRKALLEAGRLKPPEEAAETDTKPRSAKTKPKKGP